MLTTLPAYAGLMSTARALEQACLATLLMDADRSRSLVFQAGDLTLDASRQRVNQTAMTQLFTLGEQANLAEKIAALFAGDRINISEGRPVLHMRQRSAKAASNSSYTRLAGFADEIRSSPVKSVINIGIGGSDLGPAMVSAALAYHSDGPKLHYVSNVDPSHLHDVLLQCDPATTLVIITSKTFKTAETMRNGELARDWLAIAGRQDEALVGVTAAPKKAAEWGISQDKIFDFEEGVGGRYSLWSAVGLPIMIDIGPEKFGAMLAGAARMDEHFRATPMVQNLPVVMGLLRVWNRNFLGFPTHGIMPYEQRLALVPAWAQQLEMESNGKSVSRDGSPLDIATTPVIWGAAGTGCQHSFFQALHQGSDIVPLDIMIPLLPAGLRLAGNWKQSQKLLVANALAQAESLAIGRLNNEEPHRNFPGGRPSNVITWPSTTPHVLGQILALYEHVTVVSGFIWDVNSFDQWGVELGKLMALQFSAVLAGERSADGLSATAADLLAKIMANPPDEE